MGELNSQDESHNEPSKEEKLEDLESEERKNLGYIGWGDVPPEHSFKPLAVESQTLKTKEKDNSISNRQTADPKNIAIAKKEKTKENLALPILLQDEPE